MEKTTKNKICKTTKCDTMYIKNIKIIYCSEIYTVYCLDIYIICIYIIIPVDFPNEKSISVKAHWRKSKPYQNERF